MLFIISYYFYYLILETLIGYKFKLNWVKFMDSNIKLLSNEQLEKNLKIGFVGIGFMLFYYFLYFIISLLISLRYSGVEFISEFVEFSYPVVLYTSYGLIVIGLTMLVVSLTRFMKNSVEEPQVKLIKKIRNFLIIPLVVKPLTFIYVLSSSFTAWGDDAMAHLMWVGGDLLTNILLLIPFLLLAFFLRKEKKNTEFKLNFILPLILLVILCLWLLFYPTSIILFFGTTYENPLQYIMVATNAEIHMSVCALGFAIFLLIGMKFRELFISE